MSLIHLEKQGDHWRSRVEGRFILGAHPIETVRKDLPEAMAQAVVDHCAMSGEDVAVFGQRLMAEIDALAPASPAATSAAFDKINEGLTEALEIARGTATPAEPRRARVPRKAAVVAPDAERVAMEPAAAAKEDI